MKDSIKFAEELIDFCYQSPTAYHAVDTTKKLLLAENFVELDENKSWKLKAGGKYFFCRNDSALVAFIVGKNKPDQSGFKIVGAHTDSPGFRVKPAPEMVSEGKYLKLNTEVYGGPILNTWLDRPLSIAGRVVLKGKNVMRPSTKLVKIEKPICIIPNISVHMNPEVNSGFALNKQNDTLPFLGIINDRLTQDNYLINLVAAELKVKPEEIMDFDLFLFDFQKGCLTGANQELVSAGRIDDLASVHSGICALSAQKKPKSTCVMVCFDNEEVGSSTMMGADSQILASALERIVLATGGNREEYFRALAVSYLVSADGAHAVHPNMGGKCDPTSRPSVNGGLVIKMSANKSYTSDGKSSAIFAQICEEAGVKTQRFVNRSDMRGGSTIGPISATHVSIASVDVGIPMLSMHSIRELCGVEDLVAMYRALQQFFTY
ncbi:MAG: M18 family aminopeptidase [Candidatus Rifleibacteriota bacterium]